MNLIDFYLKNKFTTNEHGNDIGEFSIDGSSYLLELDYDPNELLEMARSYKGVNYEKLIELAMSHGQFYIAMDIALINHDYKLCERINFEFQKIELNKESIPQSFLDEVLNPPNREELNEAVRLTIEQMKLTLRGLRDQIEDNKNTEKDTEKDVKKNSGLDIDEFFNAVALNYDIKFDDINDVKFNNYLANINNNPEDLMQHQNIQDLLRKFFPHSKNMKFYFLDDGDML